MSITYYPILKWKKGEQEALKNLKETSNFCPILEVIDDCSPADFFNSLSICYGATVCFDVNRLNPERFDEFISYVKDNHIPASPVLYVEDILTHAFSSIPQKFFVKIPIPVDFDGPTFGEIVNRLSAFDNCDINLILDAGEVLDPRTANTTFDSYARTLSENISKLSNFTNIIICLTSFPAQLTIDSGEDITYKRYDFLIFKRLIELFNSSPLYSKLQYSDYGVTKFTETELDFSKMKYGVLPKVKYTTDSHYIVKKGEKDRINNIFTRSYIDIAKEIVNSSYFYGKKFCYGDSCIYEKATQINSKPGGATQWVTYCANHHLSVLMEQLSNLCES